MVLFVSISPEPWLKGYYRFAATGHVILTVVLIAVIRLTSRIATTALFLEISLSYHLPDVFGYSAFWVSNLQSNLRLVMYATIPHLFNFRYSL